MAHGLKLRLVTQLHFDVPSSSVWKGKAWDAQRLDMEKPWVRAGSPRRLFCFGWLVNLSHALFICWVAEQALGTQSLHLLVNSSNHLLERKTCSLLHPFHFSHRHQCFLYLRNSLYSAVMESGPVDTVPIASHCSRTSPCSWGRTQRYVYVLRYVLCG